VTTPPRPPDLAQPLPAKVEEPGNACIPAATRAFDPAAVAGALAVLRA